MAIAYRILRHRHLAEEAVQEAFTAVWREPSRYRPEVGSVRSWLFGVVHHLSVDIVRREESQSERSTRFAAMASAEANPPDPGMEVPRAIAAEEESVAVRSALGQLPIEQRRIIELMYVGGFSQSQIAERASLPLGTVKSRTVSGMRRLRRSLLVDASTGVRGPGLGDPSPSAGR